MARGRARARRRRAGRRRAGPRADPVGPPGRGMGGAVMDVFGAALLALVVVIALLVTLAASSIRILREYERAVVFRLGRLIGIKGPGLILLIPWVDRMVRVDLRTVTLDIP